MTLYLERVETSYQQLQEESARLRQRIIVLQDTEKLYQKALEELRIEKQKRTDSEKKTESATYVF
jgi:cell division septum initiation protein DivIVA